MPTYLLGTDQVMEVKDSSVRHTVEALRRIGGVVRWPTLRANDGGRLVDAILNDAGKPWKVVVGPGRNGIGCVIVRVRGKTARVNLDPAAPRMGRLLAFASKYGWETMEPGDQRTYRPGFTTLTRLHSSWTSWARARRIPGGLLTVTNADGGITATRAYPAADTESLPDAALTADERAQRLREYCEASSLPVPEFGRGPMLSPAAVRRELDGQPRSEAAEALREQALPNPPGWRERKSHTADLVAQVRAQVEAAKPEGKPIDPMAELEAVLAAERTRAAAEDPELVALLAV